MYITVRSSHSIWCIVPFVGCLTVVSPSILTACSYCLPRQARTIGTLCTLVLVYFLLV